MLVSWPNGKKTSRQEACVSSCRTLTVTPLVLSLLKVTSSSKTWKPLSLSVVIVTLTTTVCSRNNSKTNGIWKHHRNSSSRPAMSPKVSWSQRANFRWLKQTVSLSDGAQRIILFQKKTKTILESVGSLQLFKQSLPDYRNGFSQSLLLLTVNSTFRSVKAVYQHHAGLPDQEEWWWCLGGRLVSVL